MAFGIPTGEGPQVLLTVEGVVGRAYGDDARPEIGWRDSVPKFVGSR